MEGPDHQASLSPDEFGMMIGEIRIIENALGSEKGRTTSESKNQDVARRSLVTSKHTSVWHYSR